MILGPGLGWLSRKRNKQLTLVADIVCDFSINHTDVRITFTLGHICSFWHFFVAVKNNQKSMNYSILGQFFFAHFFRKRFNFIDFSDATLKTCPRIF